MRRDNAIQLTRAQLGAAMLLVASVSTATFFLGYLLGEGGRGVVEPPQVELARSCALLGSELKQDSLIELLARVELIPGANAASLEYPAELRAPLPDYEPPLALAEPLAAPAQIKAEPEQAPAAPEGEVEPLSSGWSIEVGSYASLEKAQEQAGALEEEQLPVQVVSVLYGGQTRHRVRVGPISKLKDAREMQGEVASLVGAAVELVEVR